MKPHLRFALPLAALLAILVAATILLRKGPADTRAPRLRPGQAERAPMDGPVKPATPTLAGSSKKTVVRKPPVSVSRLPDGTLTSRGREVRHKFTRDGVRLTRLEKELHFSLTDIRMGNRSLLSDVETTSVAPVHGLEAHRSTVSYARGPVEEKYVLLGDTVEQVFVLDDSLAAHRGDGPLTIRVALNAELGARLAGESRSRPSVTFRDEEDRLIFRYGHATAIDADGRTELLTYALEDGVLEMNLNSKFLSTAAFPLTVDPLIGGNFEIDYTSGLRIEPDVAYSSGPDGYLVVYERASTSNGDILCKAVSGSGTPEPSEFFAGLAIDDTIAESRLPKVAGSQNENEFLVVWQHRPLAGSGPFSIRGQFVTVTANVPTLVGSTFIIYSGGLGDVVANADVGYCPSEDLYLVAWELGNGSFSNIIAATVAPDQTVGAAKPLETNLGVFDETPTVAKVLDNPMGVAWTRRPSLGGPGDILAVAYDMPTQAVAGGTVVVAGAVNNEETPDLGNSNTPSCYIVYGHQFSSLAVPGMSEFDIHGFKVSFQIAPPFVVIGAPFIVTGGIEHTTRPKIDAVESKGFKRFLVSWTESPTYPPSGTDLDIHALVADTTTDPPSGLELFSFLSTGGLQPTDDDPSAMAIRPNELEALVAWSNDYSGTFNDIWGQLIAVEPIAGVIINPSLGLVTSESGGTDSFTMVLKKQPTDDVTINLSVTAPTEVSLSTSSVVFTSSNWNIAQSVIVQGLDDDFDDGDIPFQVTTARAVSLDPDYDNLQVGNVTGTNLDDDTAGIVVVPISGLITTEHGVTDVFAVFLNSEPLDDVTIPLSSSDPTEGVPDTSSLVFSTVNWADPQIVVVSGVDDGVADGNVAYSIVTAMATSTDPTYNGLNPSDVSVFNFDDDVPGFSVTPTSGLLTSETGTIAAFAVSLNTIPTGDVVVSVVSGDTTEGNVSTSTLTFTSANALVPQRVFVQGVDDTIDDNSVVYSIQLTVLSSADPAYAPLDPPDVSVTNSDDDFIGVTIAPTSGLVTSESGLSDGFSIRLNTTPTANVTINLSSSNPAEGVVGVASVVFTPANALIPQPVSVTGVDDFVADGTVFYSIVTDPAISGDTSYSGFNPVNVSVSNTDDESPGVTVTPTTGLFTTEGGGTASFQVVLNSNPMGGVTIDVASLDASEGVVTTPSSGSLSFTGGNWNVPQTVIVTGQPDDIADGDVFYSISTLASSPDLNYNGIFVSNPLIRNRDDDQAGITVTPAAGLLTTEGGGPDSFQIVLTSQPLAPVVIDMISSDTSEGTISPSQVTFTALDWNMAQTVTVTGVNDDIDDDNLPYKVVTFPAFSSDGLYDARNPLDVIVANADDDTAGLVLGPPSGPTTEAMGQATFTVALNSEPLANVMVQFSSTDTTEGTVDPPDTLTFTPGDWNMAQTITVTGVDDMISDGDIVYTVESLPATSTDSKYNGLDGGDATLTNNDDDGAAAVLVNVTDPVTDENMDTGSFTVVLNTQPTDDVTIPVMSLNTGEGTIVITQLVFTSTDWNIPQPVVVTGVNDQVTDGNVGYTVEVGDPSSSDPAYDALTNLSTPDAMMTNNDNEPEVSLTLSDGMAAEPADTGRFIVTRSGDPDVGPLTVNFTVAGSAIEGTDYGIIGTSVMIADGSSSADIFINPLIDFMAEPVEDVIITLVGGSYTLVGPGPETVTITDDDIVGVVVTPIDSVTDENFGTGSFEVMLSSQPSDDVTIPISSSDTTEGDVSPMLLTFTNGNWNVAQTVTVTGANDTLTDGNVGYTILTGDPSSSDSDYNDLTAGDVADVPMTNNDNEPEVSLTLTTGAASEAGPVSGVFTVTRTGSTAGSLTVNFTRGGSATHVTDYDPIGLSVVIPALAASAPITVTPVDDAFTEGPETVILTLAAGSYTIVAPGPETVTIADNDSVGVTTTVTDGITDENGDTGSFTVELDSEPMADVTIPIMSLDSGEGSVTVSSLTFTPLDWNVPQPVTVTGENDTMTDGNIMYFIQVGDPSSLGDAAYNALDDTDTTDAGLTNNDNEPEVSLSLTDGMAAEPADPGTFTVTRTGLQTADLTVNFTVAGTATEGTDYGTIGLSVPIPMNSASATILISPMNDFDAEGQETVEVTLGAGAYTITAAGPETVTIDDDDFVGITVTPSGDSTTDEDGDTATFDVVLDSQPTADVTLPITSSDTGEGTVSASTLTFTNGNWNVAQTITVTGANDAVTDGNVGYTILTGDPASADPAYDALTAASVADVAMTNNDNEPEVSIAVIDASASETGPDQGVFRITRTGDPNVGSLTVNFTKGGTVTHTGPTADYADIGVSVMIPDTQSSVDITITPVDDPIAEGPEDLTLTLAAGAYTIAAGGPETVTIADNNIVGITVSPIDSVTDENLDTGSFSVVLNTVPAGDVTLDVTTARPLESQLSTVASPGQATTKTLTFTMGNWSVPQIVTIHGLNDLLTDGDQVYLITTDDPMSGADPAYDGLTAANVADITTTNLDNEPEVSILATDNMADEALLDPGVFTVSRSGDPDVGDLTVNFTVAGSATEGADYGAIGVSVLIPDGFPSATITVTPIQDFISEGPEDVVVTLAANPAYTLFGTITDTVSIADNDNVGVSVVAGADMITDENGDTGSFTVVLTSQPAGNVTIPVVSLTPGEGSAAPTPLVFTPANWNLAQTVTVTGVNDQVTDGNVMYTVQVGDPSSPGDAAYDALDNTSTLDMTLTNNDNEPEVSFTLPTDLSADETGPDSGFLTVTRSGDPDVGDLTVNFSRGGSATEVADYGAIGNSVIILDGDSSATIQIDPANDPEAEGTEDVIITLTGGLYTLVPGSIGPETITIADNDTAGVTVSPISGNTDEDGTTATFTIVLNTRPTQDVTIPLTSSNLGEGTVSPASVTFTNANWFTAQTVTVTGANDADTDGSVLYTILTGDPSSVDTFYDSLLAGDVADVSVTNDDNEPEVTLTAADATASEPGSDTGVFTVTRTGDTGAALTVNFSVAGTAVEGTDYANIGTAVTIPVGSVSATITITPLNDAISESPETVDLSLDPGAYTLVAPTADTVTINDDDAAAILVSLISGDTSENATQATFTVVLATQPTDDVTVPISIPDSSEGTASVSSLVFTSLDWNVAQPVTVTGVNDQITDGDVTHFVVTGDPTSLDTFYDGLNAGDVPDVSVTNLDNEPEVTVVASFGGAASEPSTDGEFVVSRSGMPSGDLMLNVTISGTATAGSDYVGLTLPIVISDGSGSVTLPVVVSDDLEAEQDETVILTIDPGSYTLLASTTDTVTIADDEMGGVTVTAAPGLTTTESAGTAQFTVVLNTQPTDDVTIPITSSNTNEGTVSVSSLTFTSGNWSVAQPVTITGVNDTVTDGNIAYTIVTGDPTSLDLFYGGLTDADIADVAVTNSDNEPEVSLAATDPAASETGPDSGSFTITRTGSLTGSLTVNVTVGGGATGGTDYSTIGTPVVIPATLASVVVPVDPVDDPTVEGDETVDLTLAAGSYTITTPGPATVTISDDDFAGVTVSGISGPTSETGDTATFTIVLTAEPAFNVAVPLSSSNTAEGSLAITGVTFTPADWNVPQTVTVTGVNDTVTDGDVTYAILTGDPASADPIYDALTDTDVADVTVTNSDNEPEISIVATDDAAAEQLMATGTFTVSRTGDLTALLTVQFSVGGTALEGSDYNPIGSSVDIPVGQSSATVTITPVDDILQESAETVILSLLPGPYTLVAPSSATVNIADNDTPGITISPQSGLLTTEAGGTATFTVVLNSNPTGDVTIPLVTSDSSEGTLLENTVTFTPANALTPQTVTLRGVDDTQVDGDQVYTVVTGPTVSTDSNYDGVYPPDLLASNTDDDFFGIQVSPTAGLTTSESGGTDTFAIALTSTPNASVTIALTSSNTGEGTVSPASVTFLPANALVPQTVTVTGANDFVVDGNVAYTILTNPASSLDPNYNGLDATDVAVLNQDNDAIGIVVSPTSGLFTNEGATTATFTVVLQTTPMADVTVPLTSLNLAEGTVSPPSLTFMPGNALIAQMVTVTGVDDAVADGNVTYTVETGAATSLDTDYDTFDAADVTVVNVDDENVGVTVDPTSGLVTTEAGGTATFQVMLNQAPGADVTIGLSSSNPAEGTVSPASLTFTPGNALTPQTVTVTGVDDAVVDGDVGYLIVTDPASSADLSINGINPADVSVTNTDDDVIIPPTIGLSAISLTFTAGEGGPNPTDQTLTITNSGDLVMDWTVLADQPWVLLSPLSGNLSAAGTQDVTVSIDITGLAAGTYGATITVDSTSAINAPQSVSVTLNLAPPPPTVAIDTPTTNPTTTASVSPITIGGTATNSPASVTWANAATGGSGVATGTVNWMADVPLISGINLITVYAWNAGGVGITTISVDYTAETVPPTITTPFPSYTTATSPVTISGTASDNVGVASVSWENLTTGVNGSASGTTNWSASSIPLSNGINTIEFTAVDAAGNSSTHQVTVDFTAAPDLIPPSVFITAPTTNPSFDTGNAFLALGGIASDDTAVASVTWLNEGTGGTGIAFGTTAWIANVPLAESANLIRVTATDASGNTAEVIILVTYRPSTVDTIPPILTTTVPTSGNSFNTGSDPATLQGTAADNVEVSTVVWANASSGRSGTMNGIAYWDTDVPLLQGNNVLLLTAFDTTGNNTLKVMNVGFTAPKPPPESSPAGHCGATGLEVLIPLGLLGLAGRFVRRRRRMKS